MISDIVIVRTLLCFVVGFIIGLIITSLYLHFRR